MAEARQRSDWLRVGIAVAWIVNRNGWTKQPVDPLKIIPAQFHPPKPKLPELTPEETVEQNAAMWGEIDNRLGITG